MSRSKDFRYEYANAFAIQVGDNDVIIRFGINEVPGKSAEFVDQIGIILTPRSAKVLIHALGNAIEALEGEIGPILLPAGKMEEISKSIKRVGPNDE